MISAQRVALGAALIGSLGLAGCGGGSGGMFPSPMASAPPPQPVMSPTVTADGTQQFAVPPEGRAVLRQRLTEVMQGQLEDVRVSNGWRTAAGARSNPNDYAACVSTIAGGQTRFFVIVVSGAAVSGFVSGPDATARCNDPNRVVQWVPFPEAMVLG